MKIQLLVIGDSCLDIDLYPGKIKGGQRELEKIKITPGGSGGNTAYISSMIGIKTLLLTTIAKDIQGYILENLIGEKYPNLIKKILYTKKGETCTTINIIDKRGVRRTYFTMKSFFPSGALRKIEYNPRIIHVSGYVLELIPIKELICFLKERKNESTIIFGLHPRVYLFRDLVLEKLFENIDIVIGTIDEYKKLLHIGEQKEVLEKINRMKKPDLKIITMGGKGALGMKDDVVIRVPAKRPDKIVRLKGAGDSFNAGIIYGLLKKFELKNMLEAASHIASAWIEEDEEKITRSVFDNI